MSDTPETDATTFSIACNEPVSQVSTLEALCRRLERERDEARSAAEQWERECREQCRINGFGASRESRLLATVDELSKQRDRLADAGEYLVNKWRTIAAELDGRLHHLPEGVAMDCADDLEQALAAVKGGEV